jgi:hypothetical protein
MKRLSLALIVLPTILMIGCAGGAERQKEYAELSARAEDEVRLASASGFLWSNTESHLAQAREAHKAGDLKKAIRLAQQALDEAVLAQKQAAENADVKADYTYR